MNPSASAQNSPPFFGLTNDLIFKLFLERNLDVLSAMLSAVLGEAVIVEAVLNPGLPGAGVADKLMILDVRVRFRDGRRAFVEMQAMASPYSDERFFAYLCREYSSQIGRGQGYSGLSATIGVVWYAHAPRPSCGFHETFRLRGEHTGQLYNDALTLHVLQLGLLPQGSTHAATEAERQLRLWGRLTSAKSREELQALVDEEPTMNDAVSRLMMLSEEPEVARLARQRAEAEYFHQLDLQKIRAEAAAEGEARGRAETLLKLIALRFGPLDPRLELRVREGSESEINRWTDRFLVAASLADLFA